MEMRLIHILKVCSKLAWPWWQHGYSPMTLQGVEASLDVNPSEDPSSSSSSFTPSSVRVHYSQHSPANGSRKGWLDFSLVLSRWSWFMTVWNLGIISELWSQVISSRPIVVEALHHRALKRCENGISKRLFVTAVLSLNMKSLVFWQQGSG